MTREQFENCWGEADMCYFHECSADQACYQPDCPHCGGPDA